MPRKILKRPSKLKLVPPPVGVTGSKLSKNGFSYPVFNAMSSAIVGTPTVAGGGVAVTESHDEQLDSQIILCEVDNKSIVDKIVDWIDDNLENKQIHTHVDEHHITLAYGVHDTKENIEKALQDFNIPVVTLGNISIFEEDDFDVLVIEVSSRLLEEISEHLISTIDNDKPYDDINLHITIAYLNKSDKNEKYIGDSTFKGITYRPSGIFLSNRSGEIIKVKGVK